MATMKKKVRDLTKPTPDEIKLAALIDGFKSRGARFSLKVDGTTMKQPEIVKILEDFRRPFVDTRAAHKALEDGVTAIKAARDDRRSFEKKLQASLRTELGSKSDELEAFGVAKETTRKLLTTAEKAAAAAKARATREAGHPAPELSAEAPPATK